MAMPPPPRRALGDVDVVGGVCAERSGVVPDGGVAAAGGGRGGAGDASSGSTPKRTARARSSSM